MMRWPLHLVAYCVKSIGILQMMKEQKEETFTHLCYSIHMEYCSKPEPPKTRLRNMRK